MRELLSHLNLAPHQIVPNAWRVIYGCILLWPIALGPGSFLSAMEFCGCTDSKRIHGVMGIQLLVLAGKVRLNGWQVL
jgi:hypothetical protein